MSDLRGNSTPGEIKTGYTGKIVGAIVIVLGLAAVGVYVNETSPHPIKLAVTNSQLPTMPGGIESSR